MNDNMRTLKASEEGRKDVDHDGSGPKSSSWGRWKDKLAKAAAVTALGVVVLGGTRCSYDVPPLTDSDGGSDAGVLDGGDGGMDAGPTDGGHDGGEGGMDAGPTDGGMDGGGGDGGMDAGVVCGAVTTGSFFGPINTTTPRNVAGYTISYTGVNGSGDALISINCGGPDIETNHPCPVSIETDIVRASDGVPLDAGSGRIIKITPSSASATFTNVSITVSAN